MSSVVDRWSSQSIPTIYHSCLDDSLSDRRRQSVYSSYSGEHDDPVVEPAPITLEHYERLRFSLGNSPRFEPPNYRADARNRLAELTRVQFLELAMDVHDEVTRINNLDRRRPMTPPIFAPRADHTPHRNEARRKIARLRPDFLRELMSDILFELGRRYPKFKEAGESSAGACQCGSPPSTPRTRQPLSPIMVDHTFLNGDMGGVVLNATRELNHPRKYDIVSRSMSVTEVVLVLGQHGCPNISGMLDLDRCDTAPIACGGFGDVYRGHLRGGVEVAIKCPRLLVSQSEMTQMGLKAAARELHAWSKYSHPNVAQLLGVTQFRDRIGMVSPWMENGTLNQHILRVPNANRCRLCHEVASGVAYLHSMGTVHGDLKALNILVSHDGTAKLIDFGNSRLKNSSLWFTGTQTGSAFSIRWTAPELLNDGGAYTQEADVYALGMTILEVLSGEVPYPDIKSDPAVITRVVVHKQLPVRPAEAILASGGQGDLLWNLLLICWSNDPTLRPHAAEVEAEIMHITTEKLRSKRPRLARRTEDTKITQRPRR